MSLNYMYLGATIQQFQQLKFIQMTFLTDHQPKQKHNPVYIEVLVVEECFSEVLSILFSSILLYCASA